MSTTPTASASGTFAIGAGSLRCYVASPLGFTEAGRLWAEQVYLPALATVVEPVDPWALTSAEEVAAAARAGRDRELALEIGRRNLAVIRGADRLVALIDGQEVDSGTAAEIGYAAALGKRCDALRTDLRQAGEPGVAVNLQVESLVVESGGAVVRSLDDLLERLRPPA